MTDDIIVLAGKPAPSWRESVDAIKTPLAAAIPDGADGGALFWALRELMNERTGVQPLVFLDVEDICDSLTDYDGVDISDDDPDAVANALLEMRPDYCEIDDVTWCTQLLRLRANKQSLAWWAPLIGDSGHADTLPDSTWEGVRDVRIEVLVSAVEKMVADPDSFITVENTHVQA